MVSVFDVYNTVQTIINKENRGYLTKDEFNRLATQAQLEIFESYFGDKNRADSSLGPNSDDYSDIARNVEEKLTTFDNTWRFTDDDRVDLSSLSGTNVSNYLGVRYPDQFYRLGTVQVYGSGLPVIADEVSHKDLTYINLSNLTAPTTSQPVYVRHESGIRLFPQSITGSQIELVYVRRPIDPELRGTVVNSTFVPAADSVDFELHPSEQQELVAKVLTYTGVLIREQDIVAIGSQKEQQIKGTEG